MGWANHYKTLLAHQVAHNEQLEEKVAQQEQQILELQIQLHKETTEKMMFQKELQKLKDEMK